MRLGVMQAYFFPYIGYFQVIDAVDKFLIYEHVSFRKQSWINRNRLMNRSSGEAFFINVPIRKASSNKKISEIEIDYSFDWQRYLKNSIMMNYGKAPYFDEVFPVVEHCLSMECTWLHEFNALSTMEIAALLDIETEIVYDNAHHQVVEDELRGITEDTEYKAKEERVISICKKEGAGTYINPSGGMELYDKEKFKRRGIELCFTKPGNVASYNQFNHGFIPSLSLIDHLMHCGVEETKQHLKNYSLL